ncbi:hypothetical protein QJS66_16120 [Kocuria rhizophila]|nr:hypothetical protein QJS66_16120 [Kocuria rhizophila]
MDTAQSASVRRTAASRIAERAQLTRATEDLDRDLACASQAPGATPMRTTSRKRHRTLFSRYFPLTLADADRLGRLYESAPDSPHTTRHRTLGFCRGRGEPIDAAARAPTGIHPASAAWE